MFNNPTFFLSIHAFLLGVAVMSISRKHAFAMSKEYDNPEIVRRIKQYTYFFNVSLITGSISMIVVLLYLFFYSFSPNEQNIAIHDFFISISIFEVLLLSVVLVLSFGWGVIVQIITMIGSN